MEQEEREPKFQKMSTQKKAEFIQERVSSLSPEDFSERRWGKLAVRLIHPNVLWPHFRISEQGRLVSLNERTFGRRKVRGVVVELSTQNPSPYPVHTWFDIGAVEITVDEKIVIDCTKAKIIGGVFVDIFQTEIPYSKN